MNRRITSAALAMLLVACHEAERQANVVNQPTIQPETTAAPQTLTPPEPGQPGGLPDDRTPVSEAAIDPKSAQGAGQVVQHYAALVEQGRFAEARELWEDADKADALAARLSGYKEVHAQIGTPGDMEGAAGSVYVTAPLQLYGRTKSGAQFTQIGTATLRRVNDVPGSTEEQRRWHIVAIELNPA